MIMDVLPVNVRVQGSGEIYVRGHNTSGITLVVAQEGLKVFSI